LSKQSSESFPFWLFDGRFALFTIWIYRIRFRLIRISWNISSAYRNDWNQFTGIAKALAVFSKKESGIFSEEDIEPDILADALVVSRDPPA